MNKLAEPDDHISGLTNLTTVSEQTPGQPGEDKWRVLELIVPQEYFDDFSDFVIGLTGLGVEVITEPTPDQPTGRIRAYLLLNDEADKNMDLLTHRLSAINRATAGDGAQLMGASEMDAENWAENWKQYFTPVIAAGDLTIVPPWVDPETMPDRRVVTINPGMAFGTGHHYTTHLCLDALGEILVGPDLPGRAVLDVGCGTGILALSAARLGGRPCLGVDLDPLAIEAAMENATLNKLSDAVTFAQGGPEKVPGIYDLVLANLFLNELVRLAGMLVGLTNPGGRMVLSGLLEEQVTEVITAMEAAQATLLDSRFLEGWACLIFTR
ncbi:MAG: 50S ribosomal protein L11 methyltransferase [Deltaproteobacteria bacterium]|nr:50S ribosomal protein L11 methyltransferase [Deltaproteobacteria bacterium]